MSAAKIQHFQTKNFTTQDGVTLPEITLAYETYGEIKPGAKNVLVSTCFGERLAEGGNPLIGDGLALDPKKYGIVRVGLIGGSESSSPSNTPEPFNGAKFPMIRYGDMVKAHTLLLEHLGIDIDKDGLHAVVGFSMGGGIAYHWGVLYPKQVQHIVVLASSAKCSPFNYGFLEGPRNALISSGSYEPGSKGTKAFASAYCAWAYSWAWFDQEKYKDQGAKSVDDLIKSWQESMGGWDGYDLLSLTRTWQNADISIASLEQTKEPRFSSLEDALKSITCKALILPTNTDQYFDYRDSEREMKSLPNAKLHVLDTIYGHIGGGGGGTKEDNEEIDRVVGGFLSE